MWLGLPLITLGVYTLVWVYKVNAELGRFDPRRPVQPGMTLLAFLVGWVIIVPPFVALYNTGQRISQVQRAAGLAPTASGVVGILLNFVFGLWPLYYQSELNKISDRYGNPAPGVPVSLYA